MHEVLSSPAVDVVASAEIRGTLAMASRNGAVLRQPADIESYLLGHPHAAAIILPAINIARTHLGDEPQLSLEIYRDPEIGGVSLVLFARSADYPSDFYKHIRSAAAELRPIKRDIGADVTVTTDFQSPR